MSPKPPTHVRQVDLDKPNAARMYDHYLGGTHNSEADRALAAQVEQVAPWVRHVAQINRVWLWRVVDFLMAQGIRQFLDLGSGIPTAGNVHELAQRRDPATRVVLRVVGTLRACWPIGLVFIRPGLPGLVIVMATELGLGQGDDRVVVRRHGARRAGPHAAARVAACASAGRRSDVDRAGRITRTTPRVRRGGPRSLMTHAQLSGLS